MQLKAKSFGGYSFYTQNTSNQPKKSTVMGDRGVLLLESCSITLSHQRIYRMFFSKLSHIILSFVQISLSEEEKNDGSTGLDFELWRV